MKIQKIINVNGINSAVSIREGQDPVLVCIHGNSFSQKLFLPLWDDLRLSDYAMITYDLPGHGESDKPLFPDESYSLPGYASHLAQLLEILKLKDVLLLGFSLGGHIAIEAAGQFLGSSVKGLCTIGTPPLDNLGDFGKAFLPLPEGASLFEKNISNHHSQIIVDCMTSKSSSKQDFIEDIDISDVKARECLMKNIAAGKYHSEHDFIRKTKIPLLCMFGGKDKMISSEYIAQERIKSLLGNRLKISAEGDHLPRWTESEGFMVEMYSFIEELSG